MNINNSTNDSTKKSTHKNLVYVKLNIKYFQISYSFHCDK